MLEGNRHGLTHISSAENTINCWHLKSTSINLAISNKRQNTNQLPAEASHTRTSQQTYILQLVTDITTALPCHKTRKHQFMTWLLFIILTWTRITTPLFWSTVMVATKLNYYRLIATKNSLCHSSGRWWCPGTTSTGCARVVDPLIANITSV